MTRPEQYVGRAVHYYPADPIDPAPYNGHTGYAGPIPGIITRVRTDWPYADLHVMVPNGTSGGRFCVPHSGREPAPGCWCWPPYDQDSQA